MSKSTMRRSVERHLSLLLVASLTTSFVTVPAHAQVDDLRSKSYLLPPDAANNKISEYFYARNSSEVLRPISIFGRVLKPGLYHVPLGTDLATLIAISGGMQNPEKVEKIIVQTRADGRKELGLNDLISRHNEYKVQGDEIVMIDERTPLLSSDNATFIFVVTSVASLLLTAFLVTRQR